MFFLFTVNISEGGGGGGEGRGKVSPRKSAVVQSACQYHVTSRVSDFPNGEQSVHRSDRYNFEFITEILLRFLGFGDFKVPLVIDN